MADRFVLDASVAVAWLLGEDEVQPARAIADLFAQGRQAVVPPNWSLEVCNAIRKAARTGRISGEVQEQFQRAICSLPIEVDPPVIERDWTTVLPMARQFDLSTYDAAYLELAQRMKLPLATMDAQLADKALTAGVARLEFESQ